MRGVGYALAATALSGVSGMRLSLSTDGLLLPAREELAAGNLDAALALQLVVGNVLGVGAGQYTDSALKNRMGTFPATSVLRRPAAGLVVVAEGLDDAAASLPGASHWEVGSTTDDEAALHWVASSMLGASNAGAGAATAGAGVSVLFPRAEWKLSIAPSSSSLAAEQLTGRVLSATWVAGEGFVPTGAASTVPFPVGVTACSPVGELVLAHDFGLKRVRASSFTSRVGETLQCGVWEAGPHGVLLDASQGSVQQALSEAVALVLGVRQGQQAATSDGGLALYAAYLSGSANAAVEHGPGDARVQAVSSVLTLAIATAQDSLRAAFSAPGAVATVVLSAPLGSVLQRDHVARRLQSSDQDVCIDLGTCVPTTLVDPAVYTTASISTYHIVLWTAVLLVVTLLGVVYGLMGMDSVKDPQLYAQVQDATAVGTMAAAASGARGH